MLSMYAVTVSSYGASGLVKTIHELQRCVLLTSTSIVSIKHKNEVNDRSQNRFIDI